MVTARAVERAKGAKSLKKEHILLALQDLGFGDYTSAVEAELLLVQEDDELVQVSEVIGSFKSILYTHPLETQEVP